MKEQRKRNRKRWFAILLSVVFCFTLLPATAMAAAPTTPVSKNKNIWKASDPTSGKHNYHEDWVYWCQGASRYGGKMQSDGCRVVAQAKLLRETGIVTAPTSEFNPDTYIEWAWKNGYFGSKNTHFTKKIAEIDATAGQAPVAYAKTLGKSLTFVRQENLTGGSNAKNASTVMNYINEGYYVILGLSGTSHHAYVHRGKSLDAKTPVIVDSWKDNSYSPYSIIKYKDYKYWNFKYVRLYKVGNTTSTNETSTTAPPKNNGSSTSPGKQLIADGTYTLTPKSGPIHMRLDISGASKTNGGIAQIYAANTTAAQEFKFKYDKKTGTYTITNVNSGKVLDVKNGKNASGTEVQQWGSNSTNAQKWKLVSADSGYYYVVSALNDNLVLDVRSAGTANGTKVQVYNKNNSNAQQWKIQKVSKKDYYVKNNVDGSLAINANANTKNQIGQIPPGGKITIDTTIKNGKWWYGNYNGTSGYVFSDYLTATKPSVKALIKDGTYELSPKHASGMRLDVAGASTSNKANIQIFKSNGTNAQKFTFKHLGDNYYSITNANSGKVLDVTGGASKAGTNVQQYGWSNVPAQRWKATDAGNGYFYLSPDTNENLALDVNNFGKTNNTNVLVWTNKNTDNQKWKLTKTTPIKAKDEAIMKDGTYELEPKHAPGMRLDVSGASTSNKANIQIFKAHDHDAQKFTFKHLGDNYYRITNINSGKVLDVTGGSSERGANVQQYSWADVPAQRWKVTSAGSGYFYLSPDTNENLTLDVSNSGKTNNSNVLVWTNKSSDNQKWKLIKE